ncbi:hypothetical protein BWI17_07275 [Betaproteobacteria bacterium GR16-43]|nr:hypothetical protein BWI17_07275 [Betaproteobacteria bacterium GR16-43]
MSESGFESKHAAGWDALEAALHPKKRKKPKKGEAEAAPEPALPAIPATEIAKRFRSLVAHLALARDRQYRTSLIDRLHARVIAAHLAVHGARAERRGGVFTQMREFVVHGFPAEARRQWPYLLIAALTFFLPFLGGILALQFYPEFVFYLVDPETLAKIQSMYAPGNMRYGTTREADSDVMMFGHYIANNVTIDFRIVAGGAFFGLGTLAVLLFNGVFLGAVAGYLTQVGYGESFWGFVAGHSSPELLGMVYAGGAGLMIGHALIAPGRLTRAEALRRKGQGAARLLYGAAIMTVVAAFIEAFWSSRVSIPFEVKIGFGVGLAAVFFVYLTFAGRGRAA